MSHNRFRSLASIAHFTNLEELFLDDNDLNDVHTQFPKLLRLKTLMINKNHFQDLYKLVDQLGHAFPKLEHLSLLGNEACPYRITATTDGSSSSEDANIFGRNRSEEEYQRYRHLLVFRLPTLRFLDAKEIDSHERMVANKLGDILNAIAETKQSAGRRNFDEEDNESKNYTPLPQNTSNTRGRVSVGRIRHIYNGEGSQGNKFVKDHDL